MVWFVCLKVANSWKNQKSNANEEPEPFNCILKEISSNSTEVSPLGTDSRIEKIP